MKLYHYRSIKSAIREIRDCSFAFCGVSKLNDPLEGYVDIYWQGDRPAWEGLFRNYICGLYMSLTMYRLAANENQIAKSAMPVDIHGWDNLPIGQHIMSITKSFLEDPMVSAIISCLSSQNIQVFKEQLSFLLVVVHESAFYICVENMQRNGMIGTDEYTLTKPIEYPKELIDAIKLISERPEMSSEFFELIEAFNILTHDYFNTLLMKNVGDTQRMNWGMIKLDFPAIYLNQAPNMLYPRGFVVCFSSVPNNSAMWGNYADHYKGVCLEYETGENNTLKIDSGIASNSNGVNLGYRDMTLHRVNYHEARVKRNFFTSLGGLQMSQIRSWLVSDNGEASRLLNEYNDESWRKRYWDENFKAYHTKMSDWEYEKEYRLYVSNASYDGGREGKDYISLKYAPDSLTGVIWGIETSLDDKAKVIDAIQSAGRDLSTLHFYQSEYKASKNEIGIRAIRNFRL